MPECDTDNLAFFGERVTLAAIGLDQAVSGPDANRPATIWVTAEPVSIPGEPPPGARPPPPPQRWLCAQFEDGSGLGMNLDDSWQPPAPFGVADAPATPVPIGTVLVAFAALVVVVVSLVAFRRGDR